MEEIGSTDMEIAQYRQAAAKMMSILGLGRSPVGVRFLMKRDSISAEASQSQWDLVEEAIKQGHSVMNNTTAATPLVVGHKTLGVLFAQAPEMTQDHKLLDMYAAQAANMTQNSIFLSFRKILWIDLPNLV